MDTTQVLVQEESLELPGKTNAYYDILVNYVPLSWISFGGPQAHVAMFHEYFVTRRKWLSNSTFIELFAISQALPGPASTQLAFAIAYLYGGVLAAIQSHIIWRYYSLISLPGTLIMIGFAYSINYLGETFPEYLIYIINGLTSSAVGLVALSGYKLATKTLLDKTTIMIGTTTAVISIKYSSAWLFPALMIFGGLTTIIAEKNSKQDSFVDQEQLEKDFLDDPKNGVHYSRKFGFSLVAVWFLLLIIAIVVKSLENKSRSLDIISNMYYVGSIIFGGGPVVIPLLQNYVVTAQWLSNQEFLIGLALINSMPGPNFNLSAFCGALALRKSAFMFAGGFLGTIGIFTPGLLLMAGLIPFWKQFRQLKTVQTLFKGVNAAAVGLVFAAVYLLAIKSIVLTNSTGSKNMVGKLFDFPLYTAVAMVTFSASGFVGLQAPFAILLGGLVGLIYWLIN